MDGTRDDFLATAKTAATLLREPAVIEAWTEPSALAGMTVGGLAAHMAFQITAVSRALRDPIPEQQVVSVLDHYAQIEWVDADFDDEINVEIRDRAEEGGAGGPEAVSERAESAIAALTEQFVTVPNRPVRIYLWGDWSLLLDDLLITRMLELTIHADDLAVSVGIETPEFPRNAVEAVVDVLSRLAVRRHGAVDVLRALSRSERAPERITVF